MQPKTLPKNISGWIELSHPAVKANADEEETMAVMVSLPLSPPDRPERGRLCLPVVVLHQPQEIIVVKPSWQVNQLVTEESVMA